jgi:hypothetical protein
MMMAASDMHIAARFFYRKLFMYHTGTWYLYLESQTSYIMMQNTLFLPVTVLAMTDVTTCPMSDVRSLCQGF